MKQRHFLPTYAFILCLWLLSGCSNIQPVESFNNQPIPSGLSNTDIENAIRTAGIKCHWIVTVENPNLIRGDLHFEKYYVHIDIPHDNRSYSILYRESTNLKYKNGEIRGGYNKCVEKLNRNIQVQLSLIKNKRSE